MGRIAGRTTRALAVQRSKVPDITDSMQRRAGLPESVRQRLVRIALLAAAERGLERRRKRSAVKPSRRPGRPHLAWQREALAVIHDLVHEENWTKLRAASAVAAHLERTAQDIDARWVDWVKDKKDATLVRARRRVGRPRIWWEFFDRQRPLAETLRVMYHQQHGD
jgi:hypothetical protein